MKKIVLLVLALCATGVIGYRVNSMRVAVTAAFEVSPSRVDAPIMLRPTFCGAHLGEIGQYFSIRTYPENAPHPAWTTQTIGIAYNNWLGVTRIEVAGLASPELISIPGGYACAEEMTQRLQRKTQRDLCANAGIAALNPEQCSRFQAP